MDTHRYQSEVLGAVNGQNKECQNIQQQKRKLWMQWSA